jgi:uncharacterized protein (DUF1697 family)
MARHVVLLRGINLGPSRRVAMGDLRTLLTERGYEDVRTHLQSGNVVVSSPAKAADLPARLERELEEGLGMKIAVVVRSRAQLATIVEADPLRDVADDPKRYVVTFLSGTPDAAAVRELLAQDFSPERVTASGRELYTWHPNGIQKSKLARAVGDDRFGVVGTARNWNTVTKLLELAST